MSKKPLRKGYAAGGPTGGSGRPDRKTLQLCEQVRHALEYALSGESNDDFLRMLYVARVEPAPDADRLMVTVVPLTKDERPDPAEETAHQNLRDRRTGRDRGDGRRIENVKITDVHGDIEDNDQNGAPDDRKRDIPAGLLYLSRDKRQIVPAVVAPQCAQHSRAESGSKAIRRRTVSG